MSAMTITPVDGKVFGAVVTEVEVPGLSDAEFASIHDVLLEFGFLAFPGQFLTEKESARFGERFGQLEFGGAPMANQKRLDDGSFGDVLDLDSQMMRTNVGNETWHTDSTYKPISSKCAMLSAVVVPDQGGETELADLRAGYAALDAATKDRIEGLSAYHSTQYSQANDVGDFPTTDHDGMLASVYHGEAYLRPLVKVHPETGVKNLFIGRHAFGIPGLERSESRELLRSLLDFVVSDQSRVYTHRWQVGDTLLWDNRALLHRARPYDYAKPRVLIGTRVAGDPASELAYYPTDPEARGGRDALAAELALLRDEARDRRYGATTASW
ncbi:MAG: TauD/TfdA family dioxygenase [Acidimicrobiia bacterium]|nr:TauD/TfdA family dioxygenase [Acidimicrobiia bacterium]